MAAFLRRRAGRARWRLQHFAGPNTLCDLLDLRQGYVELKFEAPVDVRFRAGREELLFGSQRLIGPAVWGISGTFDALDLTLSKHQAKVDLIAGSFVRSISTI